MTTLHIRQDTPKGGRYPIRLTLKRRGQPDLEAEANIEFALTEHEQEDIRWYLADYLQRAEVTEPVTVQQVEALMKNRGKELYKQVLAGNSRTQALWYSIRNDLANLRVEITTGVAEAASVPWELMRDPDLDSPISLRVKSFVRVQSNPNISFVPIPPAPDHRVRLLYVVCRPRGDRDVELRAVANRLLQDLGPDRVLFDIKALRPPTFEQLQKELTDAKEAGRPYHIVHFDGHGIYADLSKSKLADWIPTLSNVTLGSHPSGKHGYLLFEHRSEGKMRPVDGQTIGKLLHDQGVPVLILNACQSAMHEATVAPKTVKTVHEEVRAIGSFAQAVIDQGIPAVLGMRYSVYVVTAAQYIGRLYAALAKGRSFGEAATEGRKHLQLNADRWVTLQARTLQDWFVPVVYEAMPIELFSAGPTAALGEQPELDPIQRNPVLLRYVPEEGFIGRDETLLALDRTFDSHRIVLLHAYAGQGKSSTAVEFARWYSLTGGLGAKPFVWLTSFETHTNLAGVLNQIGQPLTPFLSNPTVDWNAENDPAKRLTIVKRILRTIPILWIWDNIEPVTGFPEGTKSQWTAAEQSELRDFLKQLKHDELSKVKILLASRRDEQKWLGGIPHRVAMRRMRNSDAAWLALKLGEERELERSEIANWGPLLDYCDGNPLTLRVLVSQAVNVGLRGRRRIADFVEAIRSGEQQIEDADAEQGRDKSLGASLDYGFRNAFTPREQSLIALLHLFQGTILVDVLKCMGGDSEHVLPELQGRSVENLMKVLERAKDIGLLTHLGFGLYRIHPALPWFLRQLFARHYDGREGRATAMAALRAWAEANGKLGSFYHDQFGEGNQQVIPCLAMEEANLLHTRRTARRHGWWRALIGAMQGLRVLYEYQGRQFEWAHLVSEIIPDYCTLDHAPIAGREEHYGLVMDYRVLLARQHERNLARAAAVQKKVVIWQRKQAAAAHALGRKAPLPPEQRNHIRSLGASVFGLGQVLREQGNPDCVKAYKEAIRHMRRIQDTAAEAKVHANVGDAYMDIPAIHNLNLAERAFERSLALQISGNSYKCFLQIGMVHFERFLQSGQRRKPSKAMFQHARRAERHYLQSLYLCPPTAVPDLVPIHFQLGLLYQSLGSIEQARKHYEMAALYSEHMGDRLKAGKARFHLADLYRMTAHLDATGLLQRNLLHRAQAYAQAALCDFQNYQGRATKEKADAKDLVHQITQDLAKLSQSGVH